MLDEMTGTMKACQRKKRKENKSKSQRKIASNE